MNFALQVAALVASVAVRLTWGGIETVLFTFSVVGPLVLLVPTLLAAYLLRPHRLTWPLWVPFAGMAAAVLLASLLIAGYPEIGDPSIPLFELLGLPGHSPEWAKTIGRAGIWSFLLFLVWTLVALKRLQRGEPGLR